MAGKREKPEDIVSKPGQVEVLQGQRMTIADADRKIGMTQQNYYRWRKQHAYVPALDCPAVRFAAACCDRTGSWPQFAQVGWPGRDVRSPFINIMPSPKRSRLLTSLSSRAEQPRKRRRRDYATQWNA